MRFRLHGREGQSLVVWTTTPWTLPANVAAAVKPDAEYGRREDGDWVAVARYPEEHFVEKVRGEDLVGLRYEGPFDHLPAQDGVEHRVIPWDEVSLAEGTGIVHIAPGAGGEDFDLSREFDLPVLMPIDESGRMLPGYGDLEGLSTEEVQGPVIESLRERGLLVRAGSIEHRYPVCWRCSTPLVFRVVDDWFISAQEIRQPMLDGNATVEWTPPQYKKRMDDWLRNMGDWNISRAPLLRASAAVLRVRVRPLQRDRLARGAGGRAPCGGSTSCRSCTGPGSTTWRSAARSAAARWSASPRSVTPGSTPASSTSRRSAGRTRCGRPREAPPARPRPDGAPPAGPWYWEQWFPADWVTEMREQIRLWFYSQCFMAITLDGRQPYRRVLTYEKVYDENGREMHKSWGNAIELNEALERMGADVMRWLYCDQTPSQPLRFGFGMAEEVKKELLTFWNSVSFFVTYANIAGFEPGVAGGNEKPLDRWLAARTAQLVRDATDAFERYWTPGRRPRRSRRSSTICPTGTSAGPAGASGRRPGRAPCALACAHDRAPRDRAGHAVPRREPGATSSPGRSRCSSHRWPEASGSTRRCWPRWPRSRASSSSAGRRGDVGAQAAAAASAARRRGGRRRAAHADEIAEELRVKDVEFGEVEASELRVKPNLPVLGPKLGPELRDVRAALEAGDFEPLAGGRFRAAGHELQPRGGARRAPRARGLVGRRAGWV